MTLIKVDARISRAQIAQYISVISEAIKKVYNKLWDRLARKPDATTAISVDSSATVVPNSYSITSITTTSKARVSHYLFTDRVESLKNDNLNKSGSNFQSKEEEHDKNDDMSMMIDQEETKLSKIYKIDKKKNLSKWLDKTSIMKDET